MRGPRYAALSVRAPDGQIVRMVKDAPSPGQKNPIFRLPVLRGVFQFWDSLVLGIQMLLKSAEITAPEEMEQSKMAANLAAMLAMIMAIGLFIMLPAFLSPLLARAIGAEGRMLTTMVETAVRLAILIGYVLAVSRMQEIQRVLQYHGAEHKVIWAWENNYLSVQDRIAKDKWDRGRLAGFLAVEARCESRLHPRCGTSFLFITVLCTWLVIFLFSPEGFLPRIGFRLLMLPLVAGLSYEILKASAGRDSVVWRAVRAPGLLLQSMTTREPDDAQLEVAAESLSLLIEAERGGSL